MPSTKGPWYRWLPLTGCLVGILAATLYSATRIASCQRRAAAEADAHRLASLSEATRRNIDFGQAAMTETLLKIREWNVSHVLERNRRILWKTNGEHMDEERAVKEAVAEEQKELADLNEELAMWQEKVSTERAILQRLNSRTPPP